MRGAIGVVPQTASMFNDTIRSNILYGRRDATEEELLQAARDAQILGFIESLDLGWETMVGDRGLKLSGGEKQRTAIARCLLKVSVRTGIWIDAVWIFVVDYSVRSRVVVCDL